jgi:hypothetical protein
MKQSPSSRRCSPSDTQEKVPTFSVTGRFSSQTNLGHTLAPRLRKIHLRAIFRSAWCPKRFQSFRVCEQILYAFFHTASVRVKCTAYLILHYPNSITRSLKIMDFIMQFSLQRWFQACTSMLEFRLQYSQYSVNRVFFQVVTSCDLERHPTFFFCLTLRGL